MMDYLIIFIGGVILGGALVLLGAVRTKSNITKQVEESLATTPVTNLYTREDADRIRAEVIRQKGEDLGLPTVREMDNLYEQGQRTLGATDLDIRKSRQMFDGLTETPGLPITQDLEQKARAQYRTMWGPKEGNGK